MGAVVVTAIVIFSAGAMIQQEGEKEDTELSRRVELLESRVEKLESILFATASLSVEEAKRQLAAAKQALRDTERLHMQGFISELALQQDTFRVEQARRELDLATAESNQSIIVGEIDLLESRRRLDVAQATLRQTELLYDRGYVSGIELDRAKEAVIQLQKRLELAENKAKAAKELQELGQRQRQNLESDKDD